MRRLIILLIYGMALGSCRNENQLISSSEVVIKKVDFKLEVVPIMQNNCSPCHFKGGKMYEKMPFDEDTTIINHQAGILKRIKKEDENATLRSFLAGRIATTH